MPDTETTTDRARFHDWLANHARGTLDDEATAALAELVEQVSHLETAAAEWDREHT